VLPYATITGNDTNVKMPRNKFVSWCLPGDATDVVRLVAVKQPIATRAMPLEAAAVVNFAKPAMAAPAVATFQKTSFVATNLNLAAQPNLQ
jgi:hypothetical protein